MSAEEGRLKIRPWLFEGWITLSIQRINRYPADSVVYFVNTYPESKKLPVNRSFSLFLSKRYNHHSYNVTYYTLELL